MASREAAWYRNADMPGAPPATDLERRIREVTALDVTLGALAEILRSVLEHARHVTSAEGLSLLLYDPERNELVFAATETLQENALVCRETAAACREQPHSGAAHRADSRRRARARYDRSQASV
jgi:hypothetical protein